MLQNLSKDLLSFKEKIQDKTFLVTGGAGFLGSWFCDVLNAFGSNIVCVDNLSSGSLENIKHLLKNKNFEMIKADVCQFETERDIDYIVHMATIAAPNFYQKHPLATLDSNVIGIRNMLELARIKDVEGFLFTSTSEVYGDAKIVPTPETYWGFVNPLGVRSCYDESKRCGEAYCLSYHKEYGINTRISRIFNTYGPRLDISLPVGYGRVVIKFINQALSNKPITVYGDGKQTRSFCFVTDTIEGIFKLLLKEGLNGEVVNIGNDHEITIIEFANIVKKMTNSKSEITFHPLPPDDPKRRCPDLRKAKELLGYEPKVTLEDGLVRTIVWVKNRKL